MHPAICIRVRWFCAALTLLISGCAAINDPLNEFRPSAAGPTGAVFPDIGDGSTFIGLAFSGGGMRASAYAHGILEVLDQTLSPDGARLSSKIGFISGASGGAVPAAWFGLKGRAGIADFRPLYLDQDAESYLATSFYSPANIAGALGGGVNDRSGYTQFIDERLFAGALMGDLGTDGRPRIWINATDLANKAPFVFNDQTFRALCSDLAAFPVSEAIAASSAFPIVFSPIVLNAHGPDCAYRAPPWLEAARRDYRAPAVIRAHAATIMSYRDPGKVRFIKLIDGAISDYFGTMPFMLARAASGAGPGPFTPEQAVRLKRGLILVGNAGRLIFQDWARQKEGPGVIDLARLVVESARDSGTRASYDALRTQIAEWQREIVAWRCALSPDEVRRHRGTTQGWDCADVKIFAGIVAFDDLDPDLRERMNNMPTRLVLTGEQVDLTIDAARQAMRANPAFDEFLRSLGDGSAPVDASALGGSRRRANHG